MAVKCPGCDIDQKKGQKFLQRHSNYSYYGVERSIPETTKKQVRKECGYGCVIDGNMIVQYDHFDPEFVYLKGRHEAKGIALLCANCHVRKRGLNPTLTNEMVARYRANPYALQKKKASYPLFFLPPGPEFFRIGEVVLKGKELLLCVQERPWLSIMQPTDDAAPVRVSASFKLETGETLLELSQNELIAFPSDGFDYKEEAHMIAFTYRGESFLHLDRSDEKVMNVIRSSSYFRGFFIELKDSNIYVNGESVFGGGDLQIHCDNTMTFHLDKMYKDKISKIAK